MEDEDEQRLPAVGPSFRDATRVAGANTAIWTDIYLSNRDALIAGIDGLTERLGDVRAALQQGDAAAVSAWNERARADRDALLGAGLVGGAGGDEAIELRASVPNRPGVIAELALALGGAGVNILDMALSPSEDNRQGVSRAVGGRRAPRRPRAGADRGPRLSGGAGMNMRFEPSGGLHGRLTAPADKSLSHRAALLGAMASSPCGSRTTCTPPTPPRRSRPCARSARSWRFARAKW